MIELEKANRIINQLRSSNQKDKTLIELQRIIHNELTLQYMPGPSYTDWLTWFHESIQPINYLEIGVETGKSLQYAKSPTRCFGVDPAADITFSITAPHKIYNETSDSFFKSSVKDIVGDVQLAFIDGLHEFDQVLKDFINTEKLCQPNAVIVFHDVYPVIPETATREWSTHYWAGDSWKIMHILKRYRPDLVLKTIPAYPTGLGFVTNLNRTDQVLEKHYDEIVAEFMPLKYNDLAPINLINNDYLRIYEILNQKPKHYKQPPWIKQMIGETLK